MSTLSDPEVRVKLLGEGGRWDAGELATAIKGGLSLSVLETCPILLGLPWPNDGDPADNSAQRAQRYLTRVITDSDDPNLRALAILSNTQKPTGNRLSDIAEIFGSTTSRTGRNKLSSEILPWFLDYLADRLHGAAGHLRDPNGESVTTQPLVPLEDTGRYRPELQWPINPTDLRDVLKGRLLQIALDVSDQDRALQLAQIAASAGADLIEVGDPLIKRYGIQAAANVRRAVPGIPLVVEFSSSDWVDEQIEMAAEAGADIVSVLGLDGPHRIERAVRAARQCQVGITIGLPSHADVAEWSSIAEASGIDALTVIRNIDSAEGAAVTANRLTEVADKTSLPVAVSGGFTPANVNEILELPWSVLIVGGAFVHAPTPATVVGLLQEKIEQ